MKQYFEQFGWVFGGMCGCRENYRKYYNSQYPDWQIWMGAMGDVVQFKKVYENDIDPKLKGRAGQHNYKEAYEYWVIQNRD